MDVRDFDFDLPSELIAQEPPPERGAARLLVLTRHPESIAHTRVSALPDLLRAGDLVIVNNTRVFPARLLGRRVPSGGAVECLLVRSVSDTSLTPVRPQSGPSGHPTTTSRASDAHPMPIRPTSDAHPTDIRPTSDAHPMDIRRSSDADPTTIGSPVSDASLTPVRPQSDSSAAPQLWEALVHPGQKLKPGALVVFEGIHTLYGEILERRFFGRRVVRLWTEDGSTVDEAVDAIGHMPLPPYIKRDDRTDDRDRYQTVFAQPRGSIAAPTAGLHFTPVLLSALRARGVELTAITLHVGYGTFQPVRVERVEDHRLEAERYEIDDAAAAAIARARAAGRRIIAVGTTTTRTLEAVARANNGAIVAGRGATDLFIYPGFRFQVVGGLLTNFHLPRSSLLMLVSAFAGRELVRSAYHAAIAERYRFYSYGDAMLVL
jgi:S-adenosylmethionine:tRNA ribosyltransferase-isomerase